VYTNMDFIDWVNEEIEKRGLTQGWLAKNAITPEGEGMSPPYLGRILRRERQCSAEYVIRIARALRVEFLQLLYLAGYIKKDEVSLAKKFIPDNPQLYRIWAALRDMDNESLRLAEPIILEAAKACRTKGGAIEEKRARDGPG